jgi:hypothetical protein
MNNHETFDNTFDFSLIDFIKTSNDSNLSPEVCNNNLEHDTYLQKINQNISDAIDIYNTELLKITNINEKTDILNRKYTKMKSYLHEFKANIQEFKDFFYKTLNNDNKDEEESTNIIGQNIISIHTQIDTCQTNIDKLVKKLLKNQYIDYNSSCVKVKNLNNIFRLIRFNQNICPICMKEESTHFTVPCGHLYCLNCSEKLTITCFICRQNILKTTPLFFS